MIIAEYALVSLAALVASAAGGATITYGVPLDVDAVRSCFTSFPLSNTSRVSTANTLIALLGGVYPYVNLARVDGVDIITKISTIAADQTTTTEFEYQSQLAIAFNKLDDAHTTYRSLCFNQFYFFQPWRIAAKYDKSGKPTIFLYDMIEKSDIVKTAIYARQYFADATTMWTNAIGHDPHSLVGYTIELIDQQDPVSVIQAFADTYIGNVHTSEARFNSALLSAGYSNLNVTLRDGSFFLIDSWYPQLSSTRSYVLRGTDGSKVSVIVPWLGLFVDPDAPLTLTSDIFYSRYCQIPLSANVTPAAQDATVPVSSSFTTTTNSAVLNDPTVKFIAGDNDTAVLMTTDGSTGILVLSNFEPQNEDSVPKNETSIVEENWFTTIAKGLLKLEELGAKNLIIDLTSNGGGLMCLGVAVNRYLFPNVPYNTIDIRLTDLTSWALKAAEQLGDPTNDYLIQGSIDSFTDILSHARSSTRNGVTESFTDRFRLDCPNNFTAVAPLTRGWAPENVILVSNGLCGSTCGQFIRTLRDESGVKTFVYGGIAGASFQPSAFEGGNVVKMDKVFSSLDQLYLAATNGTTPLVPPPPANVAVPVPFSSPASGTVLLWESFSRRNDSFPEEWIPEPSDGWLPVANPLNVIDIWTAAADVLRKSTPADNGAGSPSSVSPSPGTTPGGRSGAGTVRVSFILSFLAFLTFIIYV